MARDLREREREINTLALHPSIANGQSRWITYEIQSSNGKGADGNALINARFMLLSHDQWLGLLYWYTFYPRAANVHFFIIP